MKNAYKNALEGLTIILFIALMLAVPYLLISFQQLHLDFTKWNHGSRTLCAIIGFFVFMISIGILLTESDKK